MAEPWNFEMLTLPNRLRMRVARAGRGPLVVMLHGFPECWYSWRFQLRALSRSFECVAPDMRGYGETGAPRGVANYHIDKLVTDVAGLIESLGHKRAVLVGHGWGGAVAWATAMTMPEIVDRLVVMNCPHPGKFSQHPRQSWHEIALGWPRFFFGIPYLPEAILSINDYALLARAIRRTAVNRTYLSDRDLMHFRAAFGHSYSITAALNYYRALALPGSLYDASAGWSTSKITAPTRVIWGEEDDPAVGKELTSDMDELMSAPYEVRFVPKCGHWVQQEQPQLVNSYLGEFLGDFLKSQRRR